MLDNNEDKTLQNNFPGTERIMTLVLFLIMFLVFSENFVIAPLLMDISRSLHMDTSMAANLVSVYTLFVGFGALLYGPISDKVGRYNSLAFALIGFSVCTILCGLSWDSTSIYIFRMICGMFAGILTSNVLAYVGDYYIDKGFPQSIPGTMGKVMSGMFAAIVIGVPMGILTGHFVSWENVFFILGGFSCVLFFLFVSRVERVKSIETSGRTYLLTLLQNFSYLSRLPLLKISSLLFLFQIVVTAFGTYTPLWIYSHGYDLLVQSLLYAFTGGISVFVAIRSGWISQSLGLPRTLLISNIVIVASVFLLANLNFNIWVVTLLMVFYLASVSLRIGPLQALAVASVGTHERGRYAALNSFMMQMGSTLGVFAFSLLVQNNPITDTEYSNGAAMLVLVAVVTTLLGLFVKGNLVTKTV